MIRACRLLLALSVCLALPATAADTVNAPLPNTTVAHVDLQRYAGTWYEQASLPMVFTRACTGDTTALYTPREDGMVDVRNRCRTEDGSFNQVDGEARTVGDSTSKLEVRFAPGWLSWLPMVWGDYWVIDLDKDYQWSMVGSPKQDYLWILSRDPHLDQATYDRLVDKARRMGYPVEKLQRTEQSAQQ